MMVRHAWTRRWAVAVAVGFSVLAGTVGRASAADVVVGVVDDPKLLVESSAGKSVRSQVEQYINGYQNEIRKEEKDLRDADQELARQRSLLAPEVFAEKQNAFRKRVGDFQKVVETKRRNLDRVTAQARGQIEAKIIEITQAVAKERGVNMVFSQTQVFMFEPKFDLTEAVMERLNKQLPRVSVGDPNKAPPAAPAGKK